MTRNSLMALMYALASLHTKSFGWAGHHGANRQALSYYRGLLLEADMPPLPFDQISRSSM